MLTPEGLFLLGFDVLHKAGHEFPSTNERFVVAGHHTVSQGSENSFSDIASRRKPLLAWSQCLLLAQSGQSRRCNNLVANG
jgi:hypothetical protein